MGDRKQPTPPPTNQVKPVPPPAPPERRLFKRTLTEQLRLEAMVVSKERAKNWRRMADKYTRAADALEQQLREREAEKAAFSAVLAAVEQIRQLASQTLDARSDSVNDSIVIAAILAIAEKVKP